MKLTKTWKIVIGLASLWVICYPFIFVMFMFAMIGSAAFLSASNGGENPSSMIPFLSFFFVTFPLIFASSFLQLGLSGFYLAHVIKNTQASDVLRIMFGIGVFYMPVIMMPLYYFIYIWPDSPPEWAVEANKASA